MKGSTEKNTCKAIPAKILLWTIFLFFPRGSALPEAHRRLLNSTHLDQFPLETCPTDNEEFVSTLSGVPKCCKKCPPGEGMLQLCTNYADTACRPCQDGADFSLEASATAKCVQCKQCEELHSLARFREHCTPTSDAVCQCVSGYFFIEAYSTCQGCSKCPPGFGAKKMCDWNEDSVCEPCADGTWSSRDSSVERCQACARCKPGQIEMQPCTATQNTRCCPQHNLNCRDTLEEQAFDHPDSIRRRDQFADDMAPSQTNYSDDYPMITIYCSLLGLVILTLLIYVLYKLWRQRLSEEDAKTVEVGVFHPAFENFKSNESKSKRSKMSASLKVTTDREHLLGESHLYSCVSHKSTIPDTILSELSQSLAAENDWKHVGAQLGFSEETLEHLEKVNSKETDSNAEDLAIVATRQILNSWYATRATTDSAPLTSLLLILERTPNSKHFCRLLKEYIKSSSVSLNCTTSPPQPRKAVFSPPS